MIDIVFGKKTLGAQPSIVYVIAVIRVGFERALIGCLVRSVTWWNSQIFFSKMEDKKSQK